MAMRRNKLIREEYGEDLIEYGLLAAFAAALVTGVLMNDSMGLKAVLIGAFTKVKDAFAFIG
jgi:Flp pilus assembly pilin Flp